MKIETCKSCGGNLERVGNYYVCKFCGNKWIIDADNDVHVIDRANAWSALRDCDFERAAELFENIIYKEPDNHEAYWGRALSKAGIMYVVDFDEHKKVPTCNSISEYSFKESNDVKKAISLAPRDIADAYRAQSDQIENIRVEWLKKASREKPYDIFICFKDSDREHNIERTDDSYDAHELYNILKEDGYRVFFSRVSLRDKVSEHYEPYIYNALRTAKVMIVFGEKAEYFSAVWVKNEWTRFRAMIERGEKDKNSLVVVYKNMNPGDLPTGLRSRQCLDATDFKFHESLIKHIDSIIGKSKPKGTPTPREEPLAPPPAPTPAFKKAPQPKKKKGGIMAVIAIIVAIGIVGGIVFDNLSGDTKNPEGSDGIHGIETNKGTDDVTNHPVETEINGSVVTENSSEEESSGTGDDIGGSTVTLTYFTNGGKAIEAQSYKVGETISLATPDREGYVFGGWFVDAEFTTAFESNTLTADTELYAYWVEENLPSDFIYSGNDTITIEGYLGTGTSVYIPAYINGVPVTSIASKAFENQAQITHVVVPNTVTSIGSAAFKGCNSITDITLPFVGASATSSSSSGIFGFIFGEGGSSGGTVAQSYNSYSTYHALIPQTIKNVTVTNTTQISYGAFNNCAFIESVDLPDTLLSIGEKAFYGCTSLKKVNSKTDGELVIESSTTSIGSMAFRDCKAIISLNLSDKLTSIDSYAFYGCSSITSVNGETGELNIPTGVVSIGAQAFNGLTSITKINVPGNVTTIGNAAFAGCTSITDITIPFVGNTATSTGETGVFGYIFASGSSSSGGAVAQAYNSYSTYYGLIPQTIKNVTVTGATQLSYGAFHNCSFIETITVPDTVSSIGEKAFYNCTSLKRLNSDVDGELKLPSDLISISTYAFADCKQITTVIVPQNLTSIGGRAFSGCNAISKFNGEEGEIMIPSKVTSIGAYAFNGLNKITNVTVSDSVTTIGEAAFAGCTSITDITIPFVGNTATSTGETGVFGYIFESGSSSSGGVIAQAYNSYSTYYALIPQTIKNITVTGATQLSYGAFHNCSFIETITVPDTVSSIGEKAFYNCTSLKRLNSDVDGELKLPSALISISTYAFADCKQITTVIVPQNLTSIGGRAFSGCNAISKFNGEEGEIMIPSKVTSIGAYAFNGLNKITNVTVPDSVTAIGEAAFAGCTSITDITIPFVGNTATSTGEAGVFGYIFASGSSSSGGVVAQAYNSYSTYYALIPQTIKNVTVTGATQLSYGAFHNCSFIETITVPDTVSSIGEKAFYNCTSLKRLNSDVDGELNIPTSTTQISSYAFCGCKAITAVTLSDNTNSIYGYAFAECTSIRKFNGDVGEIIIPTKVTSIGTFAFKGLNLIVKVDVPDSVSSIGKGAFSDCGSIAEIRLPFVGSSATATSSEGVFGYIFGEGSSSSASVVSQQYSSYSTFYAIIPKTLKTVTITKATQLSYGAFHNCSFIENLTLPSSTITVGTKALDNCNANIQYLYQ